MQDRKAMFRAVYVGLTAGAAMLERMKSKAKKAGPSIILATIYAYNKDM
jgi:hypothetical protein